MFRPIAIFFGLIMASQGAIVSLQATGTVTSPGLFLTTTGESITLSIQYDDSTTATVLGGVGLIFDSPIRFDVVGTNAEWFGTAPATGGISIIFNNEEVESALMFSVPSLFGNFGVNPPGYAPTSMSLEISGLTPWFSGSQLTDIASIDFTGAATASLSIGGATGPGSMRIDMDLNSFQVVPEPSAAALCLLGASLLYRRRR